MDILVYIIICFAVVELATNSELVTSHIWRFFVTLIGSLLSKTKIFNWLEQVDNYGLRKAGNILPFEQIYGEYNPVHNWKEHFIKLYYCVICAGFWISLFLSFVTGTNLYPYLNIIGNILTAIAAAVSIKYIHIIFKTISKNEQQ